MPDISLTNITSVAAVSIALSVVAAFLMPAHIFLTGIAWPLGILHARKKHFHLF